MSPKRQLMILDGNALIHRSFHALPPLTDKDGRMVNAVFGVTSTLLKAWKELKPTHIVACFDLEGPTFRDKLYKAYKATRAETAQDLLDQIPLVKEVVKGFHIPIVEKKGFEADDVIGTIAKQAKGIEKIILTGDMDSLQLVDAHTKVYTLRKGLSDTATYDATAVKERYGLRPDQIIDFKALRGDASDNIPGVAGIGEKTATELLQNFETLEALYAALAEHNHQAEALKPGVREKLAKNKTEAFLSKKLATIDRAVPISFRLEDAAIKHYDRDQVVNIFQQFQFKSLLNKLPTIDEKTGQQAALKFDLSAPVPKKPGHDYRLVNDEAAWREFWQAAKQQTAMAVDTETTDLDPHTAKLLGISFSWKTGTGWFVVFREEWQSELRWLLENPKIDKYGHNLKFDAAVLKLNGIEIQALRFDSMLASYLLNPGTRQHSLDALAFAEFGYEMMPIQALIGPNGPKQLSMEDVPLEKMAWYSSEDADYTWRLQARLAPKINQADMGGLFDTLEMPLIRVLMDMELAGIKIDVDFLSAMSKLVHGRLASAEQKIYELAGGEFNVNSPIQLKQVLFEKLKISTQGLGKTKTGVSTRADELEKLKDAHPIIPLISQQRELSKLLTTYIDALPELVNKTTGRIHTDYNQAVAATGRLSSNNPNLQNIPIRSELGAEIRKAFVAERGHRLISADYSQIELRIIASMAKDEAMMQSFQNGEDIHARTAANIAGVGLDQVTPQMRRAAKAVNFGIIYGLGYVGLAQNEGISRDEARAFIEKYFSIHKNIKAWIERTKQLARDRGYVETLLGRRRYFPEINSSNGLLAAAAERQAVNTPIQGTAADLMKLAMIQVHAGLPGISPKSKLLLQVHDELVVETPLDDVAKVSKFLKDTMERVYTLNVPIAVEVGAGKNWGETK